MNNKAAVWMAGVLLLLIALGVQGLTVQKIGIGPISVDFAAKDGGADKNSDKNSGDESTGDSGDNGKPTTPPDTRVTVPALAGKTRQAAENALAGADLEGTFAVVDSDAPVDSVVRTDPVAGARVEAHSTVRVELSRGPFAGTWVSEDPNTRSVPQLTVETISGTTASVHVWGACTPTWCDWGATTGSVSGDTLKAFYNPGFATKQVTITRAGDQLRLEIRTHFTDNSGRADYTSTQLMNRK